jgi:hypothetical protein
MTKVRLPDRDGTFTSQKIAGKTPTPTPTAPTFGSGGWIGQQLNHWWNEHSPFGSSGPGLKKKTPTRTPTVTPTPHN